jgi:hypothetical protein
MPLNTQIVRNGEPLKLPHGWGGFHVAAMVIAVALDTGEGPWEDNTLVGLFGADANSEDPIGITQKDSFDLVNYGALAATALNSGSYTLKGTYTFIDRSDGEEFILKSGDVLHAYRG